MSPPDENLFALPVTDEQLEAFRAAPPTRLPTPRKGEQFFSGRIPLGWVEVATRLPGKAWHLACALWFDGSNPIPRSRAAQPPIPPNTKNTTAAAAVASCQ